MSGKLLSDQTGGTRFKVMDKCGRSSFGWQLNQEVDMVALAMKLDEAATLMRKRLLVDAPQALQHTRSDAAATVLGDKN